MSTVQLLEFVQNTHTLEVDAEKGVIRGVRILGLQSANQRDYLREAVTKAIPMYEGRQVNLNHGARANEPVSVERRIAWLENVKQEADGGLRGDLQYLKTHPWAPVLVEAAQRRPQLLGLSHNASGRTRREGGREIVESIEAVHSVDLVADPATVSGLNEGKQMKRTVKQLIESLKASRPGYSRALKEMAEAGIMSPDASMDEPAPMGPDVTEPADHETALKQGFRGAIMAVLDDDSLDMKGKLAKIKEIMQAEEKLLGGSDKGTDTPPPPDSGPADASESRRLKLENTGLTQLMEAGVTLTPVVKMGLKGCHTEADIKALVEAAKSAAPTTAAGSKARSSAPGQTGKGGTKSITEQKIPEEPKALASWLKD